MADTKTELERKKAKLAQMREEKRRREASQKGALATSSAAGGSAASTPSSALDLEGILESLPPPKPAATMSPSALPSGTKGGDTSDLVSSPRRTKRLQQYKTEPVAIEPRERNVYTKETQTIPAMSGDIAGGEQENRAVDYYGYQHHLRHSHLLSGRVSLSGSPRFISTMEWDDEFAAHGGLLNFEETGHDIDTNATLAELQKFGVVPTTQAAEERHEEEPVKIRELSEEEKADLMLSDGFQRFFDHTTRIIERAVHELPHMNEIFTDYTGASQDELENSSANKARLLLKHGRSFMWQSAPSMGVSGAAALKQRTVTDLDWSPVFPELLLASYVATSTVGSGAGTGGGAVSSVSASTDSLKDADGTVMIWNLKFRKDTPEFVFDCQSAVMSACFAPFHPNLVVGGTYSGQIVLWDNRSPKRSPVQRSAVSNQGHTHPVYAVCVQGTQHAHNLLSLSTDGLLCSWSLETLSLPLERLELSFRQTKGIAGNCMTFFTNDVNNFVVGSQETMLFTGCRHGNKAGLLESFEGHTGPVTGVSCHPLPQATQGGLGSLFLSSSMDWTVRLWSNSMPKVSAGVGGPGTGAGALAGGGAGGVASQGTAGAVASSGAFAPIHTFEHYGDYVFDTQWSPLHPAMFASVDGQGWLYLWNMNEDYEVPASRLQNDNARAFNKLRWHNSGLHIACGDIDGKVSIFDLNEQLATPHSDEVSRLANTINDLQMANMETMMF